MNFIDVVFILLLLGGLAIGFFQGTIRLAVTIIAFYVSVLLASLYFQVVGEFFRVRFNSSFDVSRVVAFGVILLVSFLLLTVAGLYTFRYARLPASLDVFDRIVGTLLGLALSALILGMLAILLSDLFIRQDAAASINLPFMIALQNGIRGSTLLPFFGGAILPLLYNTLRPLLPPEADFIFRLGR
jgi:membrane protein required for colicin V production